MPTVRFLKVSARTEVCQEPLRGNGSEGAISQAEGAHLLAGDSYVPALFRKHAPYHHRKEALSTKPSTRGQCTTA